MFGYSMGVADVQATITFRDGSKKFIDCVQKIHHVGDFVAAGFCGDIQNGFELMQQLKSRFGSPGEKRCWIPDFVAREFGKSAKLWFSALPAGRKKTVQVMLFSVYPNGDSLPGLAQSYIAQLNSPDFTPMKVHRETAVISMGSGNSVTKYIESIEKLNQDWISLARMETQNFGELGSAIAVVLQNEMIREPTEGISSAVQICYVKRGGVALNYPSVRVDLGMPSERSIQVSTLAENWEDFRRLAKEQGIPWAKAEAFTA